MSLSDILEGSRPARHVTIRFEQNIFRCRNHTLNELSTRCLMVMKFRKAGRLARNDQFFFNGEKLTMSSTYDYLGVTFQPSLTFSKHILRRKASALAATGSLRHLHLLSIPTALKIFQMKIKPMATYGFDSIAPYMNAQQLIEIDRVKTIFLKKALRISRRESATLALHLCDTTTLAIDLKEQDGIEFKEETWSKYMDHRREREENYVEQGYRRGIAFEEDSWKEQNLLKDLGLLEHPVVRRESSVREPNKTTSAGGKSVPPLLKNGKGSPSLFFGAPLGEQPTQIVATRLREGGPDVELEVPSLLHTICSTIISCEENLVGLFRKDGSKLRQKKLLAWVLKNESATIGILPVNVLLDGHRHPEILVVHDYVSLLKEYLRSIPHGGIFPEILKKSLRKAIRHDEETAMCYVSAILLLLPKANLMTLLYFFKFISEMLDKEQTTRMDLHNLSICLAPSIFQVSHPDPKIMEANRDVLRNLVKNLPRIGLIPDYFLNEEVLSQLEAQASSKPSKSKKTPASPAAPASATKARVVRNSLLSGFKFLFQNNDRDQGFHRNGRKSAKRRPSFHGAVKSLRSPFMRKVSKSQDALHRTPSLNLTEQKFDLSCLTSGGAVDKKAGRKGRFHALRRSIGRLSRSRGRRLSISLDQLHQIRTAPDDEDVEVDEDEIQLGGRYFAGSSSTGNLYGEMLLKNIGSLSASVQSLDTAESVTSSAHDLSQAGSVASAPADVQSLSEGSPEKEEEVEFILSLSHKLRVEVGDPLEELPDGVLQEVQAAETTLVENSVEADDQAEGAGGEASPCPRTPGRKAAAEVDEAFQEIIKRTENLCLSAGKTREGRRSTGGFRSPSERRIGQARRRSGTPGGRPRSLSRHRPNTAANGLPVPCKVKRVLLDKDGRPRPLLSTSGWKAQADRPLRISPRSPTAPQQPPREMTPPVRSLSRRLSVPSIPLDDRVKSMCRRSTLGSPKRRHPTITFGKKTPIPQEKRGRVRSMAQKFEAGVAPALLSSPSPRPLQHSNRLNVQPPTKGGLAEVSPNLRAASPKGSKPHSSLTPDNMPRMKAPLLTPTPAKFKTPGRGRLTGSRTKQPPTGPLKAQHTPRRPVTRRNKGDEA
ncbi:unnamed protein product [Cyprideis torosa]|uniref:Uncharacterized protein n=1 Tax=Cyprideis torosa TaxID=163714 RepID=A0A7R8WKW2_9CRUS|nr:unnamed protein product [Cyprideis torosa]CAG0897415.1 unnamed protein product [Cyprideis torosa]